MGQRDDHEENHAHEAPEHDAHEHDEGLRGWLMSIVRPHSHDAADSIDARLESSARGIWALKISLLGLGATAAFQVVIVLISGSVALLADTIHNFSDALTVCRCGSPSSSDDGPPPAATHMATDAPRIWPVSSSS